MISAPQIASPGGWVYRADMARDWGRVCQENRSGRGGTFYVELYVDGKPYRIRNIPVQGGGKLRIPSREMAAEVLGSIRADYRNGRTKMQSIAPYLAPDASELAFSTHWKRFTDAKKAQGGHDRQLSAKRVAELEGHKRRGHLTPLLNEPIHAITTGTLEDWRDWLFGLGTIGPKTIWNVTRDVGACLHWLERRGDLNRTPPMPAVRVPEYTPRIPSPAALHRALEAIPLERRGQYLARGLMGLRPSEAWRTKASAVDMEARTLKVIGKGDRNRVIPFADEVFDWVSEFVPRDAALSGALLFRNDRAMTDDGLWTPSSSRRVWAAACKKVGLVDAEGRVLVQENEGLRHAFGTHAADRGADLEKIRRMMGHTSEKTAARYVKLATSGLIEVLPQKQNPPRTPRGPKNGNTLHKKANRDK